VSTIRNAHWRARAAPVLQQFAESITKHRLGCLLVASWVWRVLLIYRGGPLSWPDDSRYFRTAALLEHIAAGRVSAAVDLLATSLDHWFFIMIGVPPALFQIGVTKSITELTTLFGTPVSFSDDSTIWLAAAVLALGSVANIGLLHAIVRKLGGSPEAAFLAALFLACASSTLHLTRHLVPYETSLTFALWAIWVGVAREWRLRTSLLCGVLCALSFLTYNTYWITNFAVLVIHAVRGTEWRFRLKRGLSVAVAFWVPLLLLSLASVSRGGDSLFSALSQLAASVTQGDYREGWSLPWAYFWHAEHGLLMLWAAGVLIVLWRWLRGGGAAGGIALVALLPPLISYGWLAVSSTMLHRLVVAARKTNQMVPFLCLADG
jgi:hypothetical protein